MRKLAIPHGMISRAARERARRRDLLLDVLREVPMEVLARQLDIRSSRIYGWRSGEQRVPNHYLMLLEKHRCGHPIENGEDRNV